MKRAGAMERDGIQEPSDFWTQDPKQPQYTSLELIELYGSRFPDKQIPENSVEQAIINITRTIEELRSSKIGISTVVDYEILVARDEAVAEIEKIYQSSQRK